MNSFPKLLIVTGAVLIISGFVWFVGGRFFNFGRLPGDIVVDKGNFKFYFPIVTCIVISVILSLIAFIVRWLTK